MNETRKQKPVYGKGSGPGARRNNSNALRHGLKGNKLPPGTEYVEKRVNHLRRGLEALVMELKGEVSVIDAAAIQGALRWERYACLAAHWLRKEAAKLSASDRLRFAEAMATGGDKRDRNIRLLGLDHDREADLLASMYNRRPRLLPAPKGGNSESA